MEAAKSQPTSTLLPKEILMLPKVEVPIPGIEGYCLKDDEKQVVFFIFDEGVSFPDHSHCEQRGMVIDGEMTIEINGETNLFNAGDYYVVPTGATHRTNFARQTVLIDMSDAPDRYKVAP